MYIWPKMFWKNNKNRSKLSHTSYPRKILN
jgi:hypothetical protein